MIDKFIEKPITEWLKTESNTDKMGSHRYDEFYDMIFALMLCKHQRPLNVLEVGVSMFGAAASYHAFSKVPYINRYVGIDNVPLKGDVPTNMIFLLEDAYTASVLTRIRPCGYFDILIDDGTHIPEDQAYFWHNYNQFMHPDHSVIAVEDVWDDKIDLTINLFQDEKVQLYRGNPSHKAERRRDHSNILFKIRRDGVYS